MASTLISPSTLENVITKNDSIAAYLYQHHPPSQWSHILELFLLGGFHAWRSEINKGEVTVDRMNTWIQDLKRRKASSNSEKKVESRPSSRAGKYPSKPRQSSSTSTGASRNAKSAASKLPTKSKSTSTPGLQRRSIQQEPKRISGHVEMTAISSVFGNDEMKRGMNQFQPIEPYSSVGDPYQPLHGESSDEVRHLKEPKKKSSKAPKKEKLRNISPNAKRVPYDQEAWIQTFEESRKEFLRNKQRNRSISPSWNIRNDQDNESEDHEIEKQSKLIRDERQHHQNQSVQPHPTSFSSSQSPSQPPSQRELEQNKLLMRDFESESAIKRRKQNSRLHAASPGRSRYASPTRNQKSARSMDSNRSPTPRKTARSPSHKQRRPFQPVTFGLPYNINHVESKIKDQIEFDKQFSKVLQKGEEEKPQDSEKFEGKVFTSPRKQIPTEQTGSVDTLQILDNFFNEPYMKDFF